MDANTRNKILVFAVIFLTVLNLATVGSIFYNMHRLRQETQSVEQLNRPLWRPPRPTAIHRPAPRPDSNVRPPHGHNSRRFERIMDQLQLTPAQRDYFTRSRRQFFLAHHPLMDSLRYYHHVIDSLSCSANPDTSMIDYYARRLGNIHYRFTRDYALLLGDWYAHCDSKQQKIFCEIFMRNRSRQRDR